MRIVRALLALALLAAVGGSALAQGCGQGNPNCIAPTPPIGNSSNRIATTAFVQNTFASGLPLQNGKIYVGSALNFATGQTLSQDCTMANTGAITCLKTNNVAFGSMATQNASAVAITGGTAAGLTGLAVRNNAAAFDLAIVSSDAAMVAPRTIFINTLNGDRVLQLGGGIAVSGPLTTSGSTGGLTFSYSGAPTIALGAGGNVVYDTRAINTTAPLTGGGNLSTDRTFAIAANGIDNTLIRQGVARSVIGVTGNASANVADIQGAASQFLGVNAAGTALAFQSLAGDATLSGPTLTITSQAVSYSKIQNISTTQRVLGRNTVGGGSTEEVTATQLHDWIGSTQGQIIYRNATTWVALSADTSGRVLTTQGAGQNPIWSAVSGTGTVTTVVCNGGQTTITTTGTCASRETLTGNRTYFVRTDGNDSNTCLVNSAGGACLTIAAAVNKTVAIDLAGFAVTIQVVAGTYAAGVALATPFVGGQVTLTGDTGTPANVTISTAGTAISVSNGAALNVSGVKLTSSGSHCLNATNNGIIHITGNMEFGACSIASMTADNQGLIKVESAYRLTGAGSYHLNAGYMGLITNDGTPFTLTQSGALGFTTYANAQRLGEIVFFSVTYSGGTITGTRFNADSNSVLFVNGCSVSGSFQGSVNGATSSGGQCL